MKKTNHLIYSAWILGAISGASYVKKAIDFFIMGSTFQGIRHLLFSAGCFFLIPLLVVVAVEMLNTHTLEEKNINGDYENMSLDKKEEFIEALDDLENEADSRSFKDIWGE